MRAEKLVAEANADSSEEEILALHDGLLKDMASSFNSPSRDDLIQIGREALIRKFRIWKSRQAAQFWTFARKAVFGAMMDALNKGRSGAECVDASNEELSIPDLSPNPEEELLAKEANAGLLAALESLPAFQQRIVRARFVEELTLREIAEREGCSIKKVFSHIEKAMQTMREELEG